VLRLETLREFSEIVIDLKPALKLLQGVSQELIQVLPDVSAELNEVNITINDTLGATKLTSEPDTVISIGRRTEGGDQIIKEVSTYLQQKVAETLPEPPMGAPNIELKRKAPPLRELVALGASSSHAVGRRSIEEPKHDPTQTVFSYKKSEVQEISLTVEKPSIEDMLLEYVRKSNGEIDLTRCSSELNTSNQEIEKALESLGNKGRIKIELKSPE
jgi:hypothetical protein